MGREVFEQGATRWLRSSDFSGPTPAQKRNSNPPPGVYRPNKVGSPGKPSRRSPQPGEPGYNPRNPRNPDWVPPRQRPKPLPAPPPWFNKPAEPLPPPVRPSPLPGVPKGFPLRGPGFGGILIPIFDGLGGAGRELLKYERWYYRFTHQPGYWDLNRGYTKNCDNGGPHQYGPLTGGSFGCNHKSNPSRASVAASMAARAAVMAAPWPNSLAYDYIVDEYPQYSWVRRYQAQYWIKKGADFIEPEWMPDWYLVETFPAPTIGPAMDPNTMRGTPSAPSLDPTPETQPDPQLAPDNPVPVKGRTIDPSGSYPTVPRGRIPPRRRERERKVLSRSAKIGIVLFKILDKISESAEIVDAIYEALPEETRKKWGCNRSDFGIDVAGQYGIDNADCKAKALYYNWDKVDWNTAVENIIKNEIQDKVLGYVNQTVDRYGHTGAALDNSFIELNDYLNELLDAQVDLHKVW